MTSTMIYDGVRTAPILTDAAYEPNASDPFAPRSYAQVLRAVGDLRQDIAMVTGAIRYHVVRDAMVDDAVARDARLAAADGNKVPALETDPALVAGSNAIIIGSMASSALLRAIVANGGFDEARTIAGERESYAIKSIDDPLPGIGHALVVAGSDARGTIYGTYAVSERIGVSPFYWYSDVPVVVRPHIDVDFTEALVVHAPAVRFRGLFINDEDLSVTNWAARKFPVGHGTPDVNYYRHLFEMMLRLGLNTLWPAMHPVSTAFNMAEDDAGVPINAREASRYGIVIGTSHCENMLRSNPGEWEPWYRAHKSEYAMTSNGVEHADYTGAQRARFTGVSLEADRAFDFTTNRDAVIQYWRERLEANKGFESILTLGIRGIHDGGFNASGLDECYEGATVQERQVAFMTDVIRTQRALIDEVYGEGASRSVPQVLIVYKEIADVYNAGLRDVMTSEFDDVMLMWAEDNYGYLRQYPTGREAARSGGSGVYYHSSYLGSPGSWLWLNSIQPALMGEQLRHAYDTGMRAVWILNVGDVKPGDLVTEYFSRLSWDPDMWSADRIREYLVGQARRDYRLDGPDAAAVAEAVSDYHRLIGVKRAEFYTTFYHDFDLSVTDEGDEAQRMLDRARDVVERLDRVAARLDGDAADAFYEQIRYHALSMFDVLDEYVNWWKCRRAVKQGRFGSARVHERASIAAADRIRARVQDFGGCTHGKWVGYMGWQGIMCTNPIDVETWGADIIQRDQYPYLDEPGTGVGAVAEGETDVLRFSVREPRRHLFLDVFSRADGPAAWVIDAPQWVVLSSRSGVTDTERRIIVGIDWNAVAAAGAHADVVVRNAALGEDGEAGEPGDVAAVFHVEADAAWPDAAVGGHGFVEANGRVVMRAEHSSKVVVGADGSEWRYVADEGPHGGVMKAYPQTGRSAVGRGAAMLFDAYFDRAGDYRGIVKRLPTLSEGVEDDGSERSCALAVEVNGGGAQLLRGNRSWIAQKGNSFTVADMGNPWVVNMLRGVEPLEFRVRARAGWNTIVVRRVDPSIIVDGIEVETREGALGASLTGPGESPRA
ncbi:hypothetical protein GFD17_02610 [Bifidobacterium sp. SMB2]|uniref:Gylcosyl hydrolase 115 C-terminal domain-containing protein n=1 Tax=Bifidobacterium saimiriisciurei TaxID=2661627 RepID=A0ABX0CA50_9BIFI|nr:MULTISPECIES: glycosyl hydrolase 115 family protein [Bifidobacterium]NEG95662.1 hypothetical protein [Bifidobacterium sp. SMB2]NEH11089.1 hypothetical protein [Bifidobacterium saimiriisciurei]